MCVIQNGNEMHRTHFGMTAVLILVSDHNIFHTTWRKIKQKHVLFSTQVWGENIQQFHTL